MSAIIIVPYRNRPAHLAQFLSHMTKYYADQHICFIEQVEGKPFNRAVLLNIGYLENKNKYDLYIFHDVDMLPINVDYCCGYLNGVTQMVKSEIQHTDYLGGVTAFTDLMFYHAGGYHNDYFHRAEDNEMMFNLKRLWINVIEKPAKFDVLPHKRQGPEFDPALWRKAQLKRAVQNQLSVCSYEVIHVKEISKTIRHLIVKV